jgi:hypothetical protein
MTDNPIDFTAIKVGDHVLIRAEVRERCYPNEAGVSINGGIVSVMARDVVGHEPAPPIVRPTKVGQRVKGFFNIQRGDFDGLGRIVAIDGDAALIRTQEDNSPALQFLERLEVVK